MDTQIFLDHFEQLTDAPNAVARLRVLILQLAMQGRLVAQDERDEPAERLLKRIDAERKRLIREKKIKEPKPLPPVSDDEKLFELPSGWTWARFGEVATIASNLVQPDAYPDHSHVAPDNIEKQTGRLLACRTVREDEVKSANHLFYSGQIVYSKIRPNLAKATIVNFDGLCSADMYPINAHIDAQFLLKYMLSSTFLSMAVKSDTRVAMPKINQEELNKILAPVPPLEEQKRIVAKVEELMRLCDELERAQEERRAARQRLNRAALDQLLAARDAAEFQARLQMVSDHFPTLTAAPDQTAKLRQTVLQLAVQGKLTRQDPQDEPAPALLRRIRAEREHLVKEKRLKRADPLPPVNPDETPFALPSGWTWTRLGQLGITQTGTTPPTSNAAFFGNEFPFVKPADITSSSINYDKEGLSELGVEKGRLVLAGSVLMVCIGGSIGKVGMVDRDCSCNQQINYVTLHADIPPQLFYYFLKSPYFQDQVLSLAPSTTLPILSKGKWDLIALPLPPLEEQKRIVAAVNRLMALCDELEAGLRRAEEDGEQLLRAALRSLLAPSSEISAEESELVEQ